MGKKKAIVAGHICIDITPVFGDGKVRRISDVLVPGKLTNTGAAVVNTGGAVANTGLAMKLFGAEVFLIGKVGDDEFGSMTRQILRRYGADKDMISDAETGSSYSVVIAPKGIDRMFLHYTGPNDTFCAADVKDEALAGADLFHFGYPTQMRRMYQDGGAELLRLFERVKAHGIVTSLDFANVDPDSEAGGVDWLSMLQAVVPYVDFLVPSVEELAYLISPQLHAKWVERAEGGSVEDILSLQDDIRPLADRLFDFGAKVVLIKCGAPGMYYRTAGRETMQPLCDRLGLCVDEWCDLEGFEPSFRPNCVKSGTGAGDTSIGAFLTCVLEGCGLRECVRMATAAGASCVEAYDSLSGLSTFAEMRRRIANGWEKNSCPPGYVL